MSKTYEVKEQRFEIEMYLSKELLPVFGISIEFISLDSDFPPYSLSLLFTFPLLHWVILGGVNFIQKNLPKSM